jgi:hypothetical protein
MNIGATDSEYEENVDQMSFATMLNAADQDEVKPNPTNPTIAIAYDTGMRSINRTTRTTIPIMAIVVGLMASPM